MPKFSLKTSNNNSTPNVVFSEIDELKDIVSSDKLPTGLTYSHTLTG